MDQNYIPSQHCPLCAKNELQSAFRLFKVSMEESIWLCENQNCMYPIGCYGELTYQRTEENVTDMLKYSNLSNVYDLVVSFLTDESVCSNKIFVLQYILNIINDIRVCIRKTCDRFEKQEVKTLDNLFQRAISKRKGINWLTTYTKTYSKFTENINIHDVEYKIEENTFNANCEFGEININNVESYSRQIIQQSCKLEKAIFINMLVHLVEVLTLEEIRYNVFESRTYKNLSVFYNFVAQIYNIKLDNNDFAAFNEFRSYLNEYRNTSAKHINNYSYLEEEKGIGKMCHKPIVHKLDNDQNSNLNISDKQVIESEACTEMVDKNNDKTNNSINSLCKEITQMNDEIESHTICYDDSEKNVLIENSVGSEYVKQNAETDTNIKVRITEAKYASRNDKVLTYNFHKQGTELEACTKTVDKNKDNSNNAINLLHKEIIPMKADHVQSQTTTGTVSESSKFTISLLDSTNENDPKICYKDFERNVLIENSVIPEYVKRNVEADTNIKVNIAEDDIASGNDKTLTYNFDKQVTESEACMKTVHVNKDKTNNSINLLRKEKNPVKADDTQSQIIATDSESSNFTISLLDSTNEDGPDGPNICYNDYESNILIENSVVPEYVKRIVETDANIKVNVAEEKIASGNNKTYMFDQKVTESEACMKTVDKNEDRTNNPTHVLYKEIIPIKGDDIQSQTAATVLESSNFTISLLDINEDDTNICYDSERNVSIEHSVNVETNTNIKVKIAEEEIASGNDKVKTSNTDYCINRKEISPVKTVAQKKVLMITPGKKISIPGSEAVFTIALSESPVISRSNTVERSVDNDTNNQICINQENIKGSLKSSTPIEQQVTKLTPVSKKNIRTLQQISCTEMKMKPPNILHKQMSHNPKALKADSFQIKIIKPKFNLPTISSQKKLQGDQTEIVSKLNNNKKIVKQINTKAKPNILQLEESPMVIKIDTCPLKTIKPKFNVPKVSLRKDIEEDQKASITKVLENTQKHLMSLKTKKKCKLSKFVKSLSDDIDETVDVVDSSKKVSKKCQELRKTISREAMKSKSKSPVKDLMKNSSSKQGLKSTSTKEVIQKSSEQEPMLLTGNETSESSTVIEDDLIFDNIEVITQNNNTEANQIDEDWLRSLLD